MVVGANFRFGNRAAGDVATLREAGERHDFGSRASPLDGGPQVWSSTYVRTCLATGDVSGAAEALGRPFTVRGVVVEGDRRGRELGFPTANVPTDGRTATPADGVYAGWLRRCDTGERFPAAISVGTNPTFDGERVRRVEAYVLDRTDLELYGVEVEVSFVEWLRGMVRFDGVDALVATMNDDVARAREVLARVDRQARDRCPGSGGMVRGRTACPTSSTTSGRRSMPACAAAGSSAWLSWPCSSVRRPARWWASSTPTSASGSPSAARCCCSCSRSTR